MLLFYSKLLLMQLLVKIPFILLFQWGHCCNFSQYLSMLYRVSLNFYRYYLKNNMETETLCSDEDAQELLRESQISLLQLSTVEVATQLSMRNFELFRNIEPTEYIDDLFKLKSKTGCTNLKMFEEVINQETFWVASEILRETNQLKRMKIIKHFIKIALHCRECKNFNSMFAIIRYYCLIILILKKKLSLTYVSPKNLFNRVN